MPACLVPLDAGQLVPLDAGLPGSPRCRPVRCASMPACLVRLDVGLSGALRCWLAWCVSMPASWFASMLACPVRFDAGLPGAPRCRPAWSASMPACLVCFDAGLPGVPRCRPAGSPRCWPVRCVSMLACLVCLDAGLPGLLRCRPVRCKKKPRFLGAGVMIHLRVCGVSVQCFNPPRYCGERRPYYRRWEHGSGARGVGWHLACFNPPRYCGEPCHQPGESGSSPRVRGTSELHRDGRPHLRFIPACAGNVLLTNKITVHPRSSGEQLPGVW